MRSAIWIVWAFIGVLSACSSSSTTQVVGGGGTGGSPGDSGISPCRNYCTTIAANCGTGTNIQYKSDLSCMNSCVAFAPGLITDTTNNTLGCRLAHAQAAAESPDQNCAAAGPSGGKVCGSYCDAYCSLMLAICPSVYEDQSTCNTACQGMTVLPDAYQLGGSGDNLQCRIYHVTFAAEGSPDVHCVHASPTPAAPCAN